MIKLSQARRVTAFAALLAFGLPAIADWCEAGDYAGTHPLAWEQHRDEVKRLLDRGQPMAAHQHLLNAYEQQITFLPADDRDGQFRVAMGEYLQYISTPQNAAPAVLDHSPPVGPPTAQFINFELGPVGGLAPDNQKYRMRIQCDELQRASVPRAIAYTVNAMQIVSRDGLADAMAIAGTAADAAYQSYRDWTMDGLAMWPWELWVNGLAIRGRGIQETAPRFQWVILRPNLAPALVTGSESSAELDYGVTLELGGVFYRGEGYRKWWGISGMAAVTDDSGVGYGGLFRWDNFTLGVAHHPRDDDTLVYVSIDLYKFVVGEEARVTAADEFFKKAVQSVVP